MPTPTSVREYCTLLAESKLLPADEVKSLYRRWKDEARGGDGDVARFRKFLVSRRYLTEWQGRMVQRGRANGFFLGGYKILDRIGSGQMGGVYKAVHALGQIVALKILPASRARNPQTLSRFQREARLLTQLDHPDVVRAFQVGEAGGVHYIVMEYLEGDTLDGVLDRRKRLPWAEAVRLVHQALGGLQHLHDRRMIHRDLKPANMMLCPAPGRDGATWNATVKILDIGLGRALFAEATPEGQVETQLTVEGSVLGTPDYLAPEQAKDASRADIRADIYSLGCVLYHCLTGRPPFTDSNIMAQMVRHATEPPAPLAGQVADVPPGLQAVMDRLLAKSPDDRYPTPAAAAAALQPFLGADGSAPTATALVPAFKAWLETESHLELPKGTLPPPGAPAKPAPPVPTAPAIAAPAGVAGGERPPALNRPVPPALTSTPRPVGVAPPRRAPAPRPPADGMEVDVELVSAPAAPNLLPAPVVVPLPPPDRSLVELDRRDWIMLAAGAVGVLGAVGLGYGVARLARKKPEEPSSET